MARDLIMTQQALWEKLDKEVDSSYPLNEDDKLNASLLLSSYFVIPYPSFIVNLDFKNMSDIAIGLFPGVTYEFLLDHVPLEYRGDFRMKYSYGTMCRQLDDYEAAITASYLRPNVPKAANRPPAFEVLGAIKSSVNALNIRMRPGAPKLEFIPLSGVTVANNYNGLRAYNDMWISYGFVPCNEPVLNFSDDPYIKAHGNEVIQKIIAAIYLYSASTDVGRTKTAVREMYDELQRMQQTVLSGPHGGNQALRKFITEAVSAAFMLDGRVGEKDINPEQHHSILAGLISLAAVLILKNDKSDVYSRGHYNDVWYVGINHYMFAENLFYLKIEKEYSCYDLMLEVVKAATEALGEPHTSTYSAYVSAPKAPKDLYIPLSSIEKDPNYADAFSGIYSYDKLWFDHGYACMTAPKLNFDTDKYIAQSGHEVIQRIIAAIYLYSVNPWTQRTKTALRATRMELDHMKREVMDGPFGKDTAFMNVVKNAEEAAFKLLQTSDSSGDTPENHSAIIRDLMALPAMLLIKGDGSDRNACGNYGDIYYSSINGYMFAEKIFKPEITKEDGCYGQIHEAIDVAKNVRKASATTSSTTKMANALHELSASIDFNDVRKIVAELQKHVDVLPSTSRHAQALNAYVTNLNKTEEAINTLLSLEWGKEEPVKPASSNAPLEFDGYFIVTSPDKVKEFTTSNLPEKLALCDGVQFGDLILKVPADVVGMFIERFSGMNGNVRYLTAEETAEVISWANSH